MSVSQGSPATLATPSDGSRRLSSEDVAARLAAVEATFSRPTVGGICVADGYGVKVVVERGALEVHDGIGGSRRTRRFDRATHGLFRLVVGNVTGVITFDALRWCEALGIGVLVLGPDDVPLLTSAPRTTDDARLRRVQAMAPDLPVGLDLARWLVSEKITGQAKVLTSRFGADDEASTVLELAGGAGSAILVTRIVRTWWSSCRGAWGVGGIQHRSRSRSRASMAA